jgi:hypothetical protein
MGWWSVGTPESFKVGVVLDVTADPRLTWRSVGEYVRK